MVVLLVASESNIWNMDGLFDCPSYIIEDGFETDHFAPIPFKANEMIRSYSDTVLPESICYMDRGRNHNLNGPTNSRIFDRIRLFL